MELKEESQFGSPSSGESVNGTPQDAPAISPPLEEKQPSEFTLQSFGTLLGSFAVMFCSVGFVNAFGVFQAYYEEGFLADKSPSTISWLGSFNIFIMFGMTFPVGYLSDKYGPRMLLPIGSVITLFALFMMSLSKQYYQLFLTQALLLGFGISLLLLPAFAVVPRWFVRNRGLALGITVSGSSLGGVIWPIILRNVLYKVGFGWGVRISAFIMLPFLLLACLTIRLPYVAPATNKPKHKADFSVVKTPVLLVLAFGLFFTYLGLFSPFFYITTWTTSLGLDSSMAFYFVSVINASSLFGRILPGLVADRIGHYNVMIASVGTSALICMCWTKATSIAGIAVLSLAYGFTSGAVISLQGACASQLVKPQSYGIAMGTVMGFLSIAGLIGTPINGQLVQKFGYLGVSLFSGLAMFIGMSILVVSRLKLNQKFISKV